MQTPYRVMRWDDVWADELDYWRAEAILSGGWMVDRMGWC